ncbi:MAG: hypothetical protein LBJ10_01470 [Clostridiales bacterium]|jgi:N-glycosylase/DNA lyase|nr:hypothetical protein [Clostridiales bacterium]
MAHGDSSGRRDGNCGGRGGIAAATAALNEASAPGAAGNTVIAGAADTAGAAGLAGAGRVSAAPDSKSSAGYAVSGAAATAGTAATASAPGTAAVAGNAGNAAAAVAGAACFRDRAINLGETLASGQTFAFIPHGGGYLGIADGKPVWAGESGGGLTVRCRAGDEGFWRRYFDLDRDYAQLLEPLFGADARLAACARAYPGMKLLRQPVWETVNEFIISANNNIRRIGNIYRGISKALGEEVVWEGVALHSYPRPAALAAAPDDALRALGAGYRAPYLTSTASVIAKGFSLELDAMEYAPALKHLMSLRGVGEKVADCVLLFSTRHGCAFPVDVWMERVMMEWYGASGSRAALKRAAQERYGSLAGVAQQYLFHGIRSGVGRTP